MRVWALVCCVGLAGCLEDIVPSHTGQGSQQQGSGNGNGNGNGNGGEDMSMSSSGGEDLAGMMTSGDGGGGAGTVAYGQACTVDGDCQSGHCQSFNMNTELLCTQTCTMLGVADPTCPNDAMCNMKGYCNPV
jgi:hypothetical protein